MTKQLLHIGTIELVSLTDDQINDVPAKIDTGADSSSIWASNIRLTKNGLYFNFFAPGSAYYRVKPVFTTAFKTTTIKNSFGGNERRYKICLKITIGEQTFSSWFSLADRSRNTYPILLGKDFLHKRFVVDVSKKNLTSKRTTAKTILVLGANQSQEFFKKVEAKSSPKVHYECVPYKALIFYIDGISTKIINTNQNKDVADYPLAYFKSHEVNPEFALSTALYLKFKGKPFVDHELLPGISRSKLSQYIKLACYSLPLPPSLCAKTAILQDRYQEIIEHLGSPFVMKEINSDRGRNNFLVKDSRTFLALLGEAPKEHIFLVQKYIENKGFLRLYVAGNKVGLAIYRTPYVHANLLKAHLNKPAGSSNAKLINLTDVPPAPQKLAIKAAACLDRQLAGVDLIQDLQTRKWYILEANNGPQLRNGSFVDEKAKMLANFFGKELKK